MTLLRTMAIFGVLLLLLAGAISGVSVAQRRLNEIRTTAQLTETTPLANAPPLIAFTTVVLGGFRGLLADYLWFRANRLQEQGNYFEMVQLGSWIVKLQPRFTGATAFLAWNMAYNISVTFNSFADRWRWVQRGIELIRDEALEYNPGDPDLLRELAWIYFHKLGQDMDDANRYYKVQMATQVTSVLGEPPVDWAALAAAPASADALRLTLGEKTTFWQRLEQAKLSFDDLERSFRKSGAFPAELQVDTLPPAQRSTLEFCLRRRWLWSAFRLDPAKVIALDARYGKLDWRVPQTHAVYWATEGLARADQEKDLGCERIVFQALNSIVRGGRIVYFKDLNTLESTPNLDLLDSTNQVYLDSMAKHPDNSSIKGGYENFLIDGIVSLYTYGQIKKATQYLAKARQRFPGPKFMLNLDEFAMGELGEDMSLATHDQAQGAIQGYLIQSYYWLTLGDDDRANGCELIARKLWQKYMAEVGNSSDERRGLPPYANMKKNAVERFLRTFPAILTDHLRQLLPKTESPSAPAPAAEGALP